MQAKHPKGFSLVELMVVTTVIGILALLAVPGVTAAAQRAEATAAEGMSDPILKDQRRQVLLQPTILTRAR